MYFARAREGKPGIWLRRAVLALVALSAFPQFAAGAPIRAACASNLDDLLRRHVYVDGRCSGRCLLVTQSCEVTYVSNEDPDNLATQELLLRLFAMTREFDVDLKETVEDLGISLDFNVRTARDQEVAQQRVLRLLTEFRDDFDKSQQALNESVEAELDKIVEQWVKVRAQYQTRNAAVKQAAVTVVKDAAKIVIAGGIEPVSGACLVCDMVKLGNAAWERLRIAYRSLATHSKKLDQEIVRFVDAVEKNTVPAGRDNAQEYFDGLAKPLLSLKLQLDRNVQKQAEVKIELDAAVTTLNQLLRQAESVGDAERPLAESLRRQIENLLKQTDELNQNLAQAKLLTDEALELHGWGLHHQKPPPYWKVKLTEFYKKAKRFFKDLGRAKEELERDPMSVDFGGSL